eukprot:TRINITY_DN72251_c0_g1_i1.p1 TRINITY_DN72251_c0_g1~~TRINITY_DN72251_c0_g1_i1.p1  ORF type:complete len:281 (+),score=82.71 TRINITY_DN72251_c0_g1_i1:81-845(+)
MAAARPGAVREVADCLQELLQLEAVHHFVQRHRATPDASHHLLEAMGFRIGHALMERLAKDKPLGNLTQDPATRKTDYTAAITFICKEFWTQAFKKRADQLSRKTDGCQFNVKDKEFRWLRHVSHSSAQKWVPGQRVELTRAIEFKSGAKVEVGTKATVLKYPGETAGTVELELPEGRRYDAKERDVAIPEGDPVRVDPVHYLTLPSGMIRGALYAINVTASVEAKLVDDAAGQQPGQPQRAEALFIVNIRNAT